MLLSIQSVLGPEDLALAGQLAGALAFADGAQTAGWHARVVKRNQQASGGDPGLASLRSLVEKRLRANALFEMAARVRRFGPILANRYETGMSYGPHVDDAIMGEIRTDVAFTLFLSPPEDYDGGELVIESPGGEQSIKLPAGALVVYPATTLHRVEAVTRGTRLAVVGWAQSLVRDAAKRELLFDLDTARQTMFAANGKSREFDLVARSFSNLLRMWSEP